MHYTGIMHQKTHNALKDFSQGQCQPLHSKTSRNTD